MAAKFGEVFLHSAGRKIAQANVSLLAKLDYAWLFEMHISWATGTAKI